MSGSASRFRSHTKRTGSSRSLSLWMPEMPGIPSVGQRGDALLDAVPGLLEGDLGDDDAAAVLVFLDVAPGRGRRRAAAGVVSAADARAAADDPAGGKIRARHDLQQFVDRNVRLVDHADQGVADFAQVVRRDRRGHAHRDAVGAVDEQVGELRGQHGRLGPPLVVIGHEVDRVELDVLQHLAAMADMRASVYRMAAGGARRSSRSFPAGRSAGGACSSPGPCGPGWDR